MASATGSHPDTGSSVRPLPGSSTTLRPATGRRFSAPKMTLLTERGFAIGCPGDGLGPLARAGVSMGTRRAAGLGPSAIALSPRIWVGSAPWPGCYQAGISPATFGCTTRKRLPIMWLSQGGHGWRLTSGLLNVGK